MPFRILRLLDKILGTILFFALVPLCSLIQRFAPAKLTTIPSTITVMKLHGGGSILVAMPALLGIRKKFPQATMALICTQETKKFAELTGIFDKFIVINSSSFGKLLLSGVAALSSCYRHDVFLDMEPHSTLAALFTPLTFAARRVGFVKAGEMHRAKGYTTPIYFNLNAPIYAFYEQAASTLGVEPATMEECQNVLRSKCENITPVLTETHARPAIYASAFTSSLSPERMMSAPQWVAQFAKQFGKTQPFTLILGGGSEETMVTNNFAAKLKVAFPSVTILVTCGTRSLRESMADINSVDEFWGVDSGPLHIARLLGKNCTSFWGPSNPAYRLRPVLGLEEKVFYRALPCSPCVHLSTVSPCKGDNQCMKKLFSDEVPPPITRL